MEDAVKNKVIGILEAKFDTFKSIEDIIIYLEESFIFGPNGYNIHYLRDEYNNVITEWLATKTI